jgi:hypothetical protein
MALLVSLVMLTNVYAIDKEILIRDMASASVTIQIEQVNEEDENLIDIKSAGSGLLISKQMPNGDEKEWVNFVLTNSHVIPPAHIFLFKQNEDGEIEIVTEIFDIKVIQITQTDSGEPVTIERKAEIWLRDTVNDLAILRLKQPIEDVSIKLVDKVVPVGTDVYCMASPHGVLGHDTLVKGIVSYVRRFRNGVDTDELNIATAMGSSGGGIFLTENSKKAGRCAGLMVMKVADCCELGFMIPARSIRKWAVDNDVGWLFNENEEIPTLKELNGESETD